MLLLAVALIMLMLLILFRVIFNNHSFLKWIIYFPALPLISSLICLFSEKRTDIYKIVIIMTIGLMISVTRFDDIISVYQMLSILVGGAVAMGIVYFAKK